MEDSKRIHDYLIAKGIQCVSVLKDTLQYLAQVPYDTNSILLKRYLPALDSGVYGYRSFVEFDDILYDVYVSYVYTTIPTTTYTLYTNSPIVTWTTNAASSIGITTGTTSVYTSSGQIRYK